MRSPNICKFLHAANALAKQRSLHCTASLKVSSPNVDPAEVAKFAALAADWWHPNGSAAPLHRLNPLRISYIRNSIERHILSLRSSTTDSSTKAPPSKPLSNIDVVDLGCGAGLVTEPLARLGASVLGVDMSRPSIEAARHHAHSDFSLTRAGNLTYREASAERLVSEGTSFDAVLALEIVEHVPDVPKFLRAAAALVRPGGVLVVSSINRTPQSYALAIIAVEQVLGWLPPGTHEWERFVKPEEVETALRSEAQLDIIDTTGVMYNPLSATFRLTADISVNYMLTATRPHNINVNVVKPGNA